MHNSETTPRQQWLTDRDLAARYGVSRVTVWRWTRAGHLPAPRKIGPNTSRWSADEIEARDTELTRGAA